ncbi:MAG: hypothetical protein F6K62_12365 [Sphaerospermopsis sp. SIO1G2]|nr:hypothetical protein [Sphaerospermopsis sp. SIO1G2]
MYPMKEWRSLLSKVSSVQMRQGAGRELKTFFYLSKSRSVQGFYVFTS